MTEPRVLNTAHLATLLTSRQRLGAWPTVEAMIRGRARRRLMANLVLAALVVGAVVLVAVWLRP